MTKAERIMIVAAVRVLKAEHVEPMLVAEFLEQMLRDDDEVNAAMQRHPAGKAKS